MRVLVACEESQTVCKAFRELGHEAYSADIQEPSGGHPEWHILGDVLPNNAELFGRYPNGKAKTWEDQISRSGKVRSVTFPGIGKAMAQQWGGNLNE